jgi:hypothetical protein
MWGFLKFTGPFRDPFLWNFLFIWVVRVGGRPGTVTVLIGVVKKFDAVFGGAQKEETCARWGCKFFGGGCQVCLGAKTFVLM